MNNRVTPEALEVLNQVLFPTPLSEMNYNKALDPTMGSESGVVIIKWK